MALSGPVIVVADEASQVHEALVAGGNLPVRAASAADAAALVAETQPSAVVLADRAADPDYHHAKAIANAGDRCGGSIIPIMAIGGSMLNKKTVPPGPGTFPTNGILFTALLVGVIVIVSALTFFPALSLGPVVEHFVAQSGKVY